MAPAASADMHRLEARIASFDAVTRPKRAAKVAFPLSADEYPNLTPEILAAAGFYHTPTASDPDNCRCFMCHLTLGGWEAGDNPHVEHLKRDCECAWREIVCTLEVDRTEGGPGRLRTEYPSADELPSSDRRADLRLTTFGDWWPHAKPTALDLAQAGFIFTPSKNSADATTCPLCQYEVEDWEEGDEPLEVHRRKQPDCPFFTATVAAGGKKAATKGRRTTKAGTKKATRAAQPDPEPEPEPVAEEVKAEEDDKEELAPPKRRGRPPKSSTASTTTTAAKPRAKRKTAAEKRAEEAAAAEAAAAEEAGAENSLELPEDNDASMVVDAAPPKEESRRTTRSRSASQARAPSEEPAARQTKPLPRKGKTRTRKTTQNEVATETEAPSRATRSAPARKGTESAAPTPPPKAPAPAPLSQLERFANIPPPPTPPPKSEKRPTATVAQAAAEVVKAVSGQEGGPASLSAEDKAMTLEDYVRRLFKREHDSIRERGEAGIVAWENTAREGRERLERTFAQ